MLHFATQSTFELLFTANKRYTDVRTKICRLGTFRVVADFLDYNFSLIDVTTSALCAEGLFKCLNSSTFFCVFQNFPV